MEFVVEIKAWGEAKFRLNRIDSKKGKKLEG
jgi:hypothetical protein